MKDLTKLAQQVHKQAAQSINGLLTPEIMAQMTPDQIKMVNAATSPLNLSGDLSGKLNELQSLLSKLK